MRLLALALPLYLMAAQVLGDPLHFSIHRIRPMTSQIPAVTAFFYQQPVVLDRVLHKGLRLQSGDLSFAARSEAVPLLASEFPEACLEFPIVFAKAADGEWLALAMTGLKSGTNAFVDAQGRWTARMLPASLRRYPFILAAGEKGELSLAADLAARQLGAKKGEALFDAQGEPTELMRNLMAALANFQAEVSQTGRFVQELDQAGVLMQQNLQVRIDDGRNAVVEGVWIVDEAKLRELPDAQVLAWFKGGQLAALHAQMLSLRNLVPLLERSQGTSVPTKAEEVGKPAIKSGKRTATTKSETTI